MSDKAWLELKLPDHFRFVGVMRQLALKWRLDVLDCCRHLYVSAAGVRSERVENIHAVAYYPLLPSYITAHLRLYWHGIVFGVL